MIDVQTGFPEEGQYVHRADEPRKTFVLSDIHGNFAMLWSLLNQEGLVDDTEVLTELGRNTVIVSVGDLLNAVFRDVHGDEMCAHVAKDWFDFILVGNHEWPYLFSTATFGGYYNHPPLRSLYNQWKREGFVRAAHVVGDTFISHAGWARWPFDNPEETEAKDAWEPKTARDAYDRATSAFERYPDTDDRVVLDMISEARGGWTPIGGILWSDWRAEPKLQNFNQIVGHTPSPKDHPDLRKYDNGKWSLCIDSGCKGGGVPSGVWLDENGEIIKVVSLEQNKEDNGTI